MSVSPSEGGEALGFYDRIPPGLVAGFLVGAVLAGVHSVDTRLDQKIWKNPTETDIKGLTDAKEAGLVVPGLGAESGDVQAKLVRLGKEMGYVEYASGGASVQGLAKVIKRRVRHVEKLHLWGHSMGTVMAFEALAEADLPNTELGTVCVVGSPLSTENVHKWLLVALAQKTGMINGPGSKFVGSLLRGLIQDRLGVGAAFSRAAYDSTNGCSGKRFGSDLNSLVTISAQPYKKRVEKYRRLVGDDTRIVYFAPEDPSMDTTVKTEEAAADYQRLAHDIGASYRRERVRMGHADYEASAEALNAMLEKERSETSLPPDYLAAA